MLVSTLLLLSACGPSTELLVDIQSDLRPTDEFDRVTVSLRAPGSATPLRSTTVNPSPFDDYENGKRVAEFDALEPGAYLVEASVELSTGGVAHVEQEVELSGTRGISLLITRDCGTITCPASGSRPEQTSCHGGQCSATSCSRAAPSSCPSECATGGDCPTLSDCATAECLEGACFYRAGDCASGSECRVELGCGIARPDGGRDAGTDVNGDASADASEDVSEDASEDAPSIDRPDVGPGGTPWQVRAGFTHLCAFRVGEPGVYCWGENRYGGIGDGTTENALMATPVVDLPGNVLDVSAGDKATCAVTSVGTYCWGYNFKGQLGDGSTENRSLPAPIAGRFVLNAIGFGNWHACGITEDALGVCWGTNDNAELGRGTRSPMGLVPALVEDLSPISSLAAEAQGTCAIDASQDVVCWGRTRYIGTGTGEAYDLRPVTSPFLSDVVQLAGGSSHGCARTSGGSVWCWGANNTGQVGDPSLSSYDRPTEITVAATPIDLVAAQSSTLLLSDAGELFGWGENGAGRLGSPELRHNTPALATFTVPGASHLALTGQSACASVGSRVLCWGANSLGQLGTGTTMNSPLPVAVIGLPD